MNIKSKFNIGDIVYYANWSEIKKFRIKSINFLSQTGLRYGDKKGSIIGNYKEKELFTSLKEAKKGIIKEIQAYGKESENRINKIREKDTCTLRK